MKEEIVHQDFVVDLCLNGECYIIRVPFAGTRKERDAVLRFVRLLTTKCKRNEYEL